MKKTYFDVSKRDVFVIGNYGQGNLGDDILADYILRVVCEEVDAKRLIVTAPTNSHLEKDFPGIMTIPGPQAVKFASHPSQKVIFGGGGQFYAFSPKNLHWTFKTVGGLRSIKSFYYWRNFGLLRHQQPRKYAFCIGVGPLDSRISQWMTRHFFKMFDNVSVRDKTSQKLSGLSCAELVTDPSIELINRFSFEIQHKPKTLAIIVRLWPHKPDTRNLNNSLRWLAQVLRARGWVVQFVVFQKKDAALLPSSENVKSWDPEKETILEFCEYLSHFQVAVTTRGHGVLLSSILGVIPIPVKLEPKLEVVADLCGYNSNVQSIDKTPLEFASIVEQASMSDPIVRTWKKELEILSIETRRLRNWLQD